MAVMEIIKAAEDNLYSGKWYFNQMDRSCAQMVIKGTWLFREKQDAGLMRDSLVRLLSYYPHVAGRIGNGGYIEMNNQGIGFCADEKDSITIEEVLHDRKAVDRYGAPMELKKVLDGEAPLMNARITNVGDGSVLSVHCAHICMDGSTFYSMVRNWGLAARGVRIDAPVIDQSLYPVADGKLSRDEVLAKAEQLHWKKVSFLSLFAKIYQDITGVNRNRSDAIRIPGAVIERLGSAAGVGGDRNYGRHALLCAVITRMLSELSRIKNDAVCSVLSVADIRGRVPSLPRGFAGNAVINILSDEFTAGADVSVIAGAVDRRLKEMLADPAELERYVVINLYAMEYSLPLIPFDIRGMSRRKPTVIYINNFSNFPMYDVDFGAGRPFRILPHDLPDMVKIFPAADGDGVEVYLTGYPAKYYNRLSGDKGKWLKDVFAGLLKNIS